MLISASSRKYAQAAFKEAVLLKSPQQWGFTAISCGAAALQASKVNEGLYYYQMANRLGKQLNDDTMFANSLRGIAQARWYKADLQLAIDTIQLARQYFKKLGYRFNYEYADATLTISTIYGDQGNYEKALNG